MKSDILLLEDDILLGESLQDLLEEEGYLPYLCRNGQEALDATYKHRFSLYLLDINVPLIDGLSLLKELRGADDTTPAIFLTSYKDKEIIKESFENGADDYLKKPFDSDELLWRIKAILRRREPDKTICAGALQLDRKHQRISLDGKELSLSKKEYALLSLLIRYAEKVVTKEMIVSELWSDAQDISDGAIRVYINRLKQAIGSESIENIRAVGYRLVP